MFGFGSKAAEQRKSEAAAEARVKRAHSVWDYADLSKRTSLLNNIIDTQDDKIFLAYVHAPWSQIPFNDQMKLTMEVMKLDGNEKLSRRAGEIVAGIFSAETFHSLFGEKPLASNWTSNDALGVWHSLGRFCFLISIGSIKGFQKHEVDFVIKTGQASMMSVWRMSKPVLFSFERFNGDRLASVFVTYKSLSSAEMYNTFFSFFVSEILGDHVSFTPEDVSASGIERILKGQVADLDPLLLNKVSSAFTQLQVQIRDYVSQFWDKT
ncbi:MAG: hypothetical protein KGM96_12115 [Acidobacteriota bacterium]|nr:hypothetical protein [Acidobacteriota bacterium]